MIKIKVSAFSIIVRQIMQYHYCIIFIIFRGNKNMKYKVKKIVTIVLICVFSIAICNITFAHSGKTDSNGGHKDNKNKSGLGSYHYHCGGYPAHLHTNGVCPYSSNSSTAANKNSKTTSKTSSSSTSSNSSANSKSGTSSNSSANSKSSISSNSSTSSKSSSSVSSKSNSNTNSKSNQTSTSSANSKSTTTSNVTSQSTSPTYASSKTQNTIEAQSTDKKGERNNIVNSITTENVQNNINIVSSTNSEGPNPLGIILALGTLGGGGYWGYKKLKKHSK